MPAKAFRSVQMRRLRELPFDERNFARAATEDRQHGSIGLRLAPRIFAEAIEAERENRGTAGGRSRRSVCVQTDEQVGLVVVGDRGAAVCADAIVAVFVGQQDAHAEASFDDGLHAARNRERDIFLDRAARAFNAAVVAAVPRIDDDGAERRSGTAAEHRQRAGCDCGSRCAGRGRPGRKGRGRRFGRRGEKLDRDDCGRTARGGRRGAERAEPLAQVHLNRGRVGRADGRQQSLRRWRRRKRGIERVGVDAQQQPILLLRHGRGRAWRDLKRHPQRRRAVVVLRRHVRNAQIAHDQQTRTRPEVELHVVDWRERAVDELHGHEPSVAASRQRDRHRDQPPGCRHERLIGREHDRLILVARRHRFCGRVVSNLQLEQIGEIVEPDHLMVLHFGGGQCASPVTRQNRNGTALRKKHVVSGFSRTPDESRTPQHSGAECCCRERQQAECVRDVSNTATCQKVYMIAVGLS